MVGLLLAGYLALRALSVGQVLLAPLLVAPVVVYLLHPVVGALQRRGVPRPAGTALTAVTGLGLLTVTVAVLAPPLVEQARAGVEALPSDLEALEARIDSLAGRLGVPVDVVLLGGSLAGILGLLVAVPLAASARVVARQVWTRKVSHPPPAPT